MDVVFYDHPADVEFEVYGDTLEDVFKNVALVVFDLMSPIQNIEAKEKRKIEVESEDLESLLYDFIEQIIIFHDAENLVFRDVEDLVIKTDGQNRLEAVIVGEYYDENKHESGITIKAITYHEMKIGRKERNGKEVWYAHVVLDI